MKHHYQSEASEASVAIQLSLGTSLPVYVYRPPSGRLFQIFVSTFSGWFCSGGHYLGQFCQTWTDFQFFKCIWKLAARRFKNINSKTISRVFFTPKIDCENWNLAKCRIWSRLWWIVLPFIDGFSNFQLHLKACIKAFQKIKLEKICQFFFTQNLDNEIFFGPKCRFGAGFGQ